MIQSTKMEKRPKSKFRQISTGPVDTRFCYHFMWETCIFDIYFSNYNEIVTQHMNQLYIFFFDSELSEN